MNISKVDKELAVEKNITAEDIKFYDISNPPFDIRGVFFENGKYRRISEKLAQISYGLKYHHAKTSGGRVRFKTDSKTIVLSAKLNGVVKISHFALTGSAGFDMYFRENNREKYFGTFIPPFDVEEEYESKLDFGSRQMRDITINFPLYSGVSKLEIGLEKDAALESPCEYKYTKPIVYYGHSITQGGCASRPGNSFASIISRRFDTDYINLGFSGSAKAEPEISEHVAGLDMSLLVYDYDHNAPNADYLRKTHEKMFLKVREQHPDLPVIMMTTTAMPRFDIDHMERKQVVMDTYKNAVDRGDKNVYFLDGSKIFEMAGEEDYYSGTVEGNHMNDLGFYYVAKVLGDMIEKILF